MSAFYAHFYSGMPFAALPVLALCLFFGTFVAVVVRVSLASRRKEIDAAARLPFDDHEIAHPDPLQRRPRS
jgi:cbb3-type cytochrome oxidase subunit 3